MKTITVVLVNWNQYEYTAACIRSLLAADAPPGGTLRIVLVDNGSADGSGARLQAAFGGQIDVLCNGANRGFAGGNNAGIRQALANGADYVLLLNNDTVVAPDFLPALAARLEADPQVGAVTGKIYYAHDPTLLWAAGGQVRLWLGEAQNRGAGARDRGQYDQPQAVDFVTGCCLLASRAVWERVGPLDERYFLYYEDADWCLRLRAAGRLNWYEPRAHIWHWAGAASKGAAPARGQGTTSAAVYYYTTRNNLWFVRAYTPKPLLPLAVAAVLVRRMGLYSAVFTGLRRWAKLKALWRGWADGWAGERGGRAGSPPTW